jgi:KDO2-lipid IV(A) lauroyltransferase
MKARSRVRDWVEYVPAYLLLKGLGLMPRRWALEIGYLIGGLTYRLWGRLRRVGLRNLELALPELSQSQRQRILQCAFRNLGRLLAEFSQFSKLNPANIAQVVEYDGLEHYLQASAQGRGVLILTAHLGAWELSAFAHAMYGYPMHFLARHLDNPLLDELAEQYRTLSGSRGIDKKQAARHVLHALKRGDTVGILLDLNTQPHEGVFCDFFGLSACTSPIVASLALRTGAPVVPGFLVWDETRQKHRLHFDRPVEISDTGDLQHDVKVNTTRFNAIIEAAIRRHPDQWLWVHKRWHTRPQSQADLYAESPRQRS